MKGLTARAANVPLMTQTTFTVAALVVGFTLAVLIVLSAVAMGAVTGT